MFWAGKGQSGGEGESGFLGCGVGQAGLLTRAFSRQRSASLRSLRAAADAQIVGPPDERLGGNGHSGIPCWRWRGAVAGPSAGWRRGAGHPWPGVRIERGARLGRGVSSGRCPRPIAGGWSSLESARRERGVRSAEGAVPWPEAGRKPVVVRAVGAAGRARRWGGWPSESAPFPSGRGPQCWRGPVGVAGDGTGGGDGGPSGRRRFG